MRNPSTAREGDVPPPAVRAIGPYQALAALGKGSSGAVLLARRPGVERLFAIKLLQTDLDPEGLARLRREAEVASRLEHPGIVQVHDVGEHAGRAYLVMDHIPGPTLKDVLARGGPMTSAAAAGLVAELAAAIDVAHRAGIVHRDLKPANVIMDGRDGRPKVTDFGLARDLSRPSELTQTGAVLGTPYYMAPEQVRGEPVDARADVYALGVILYELLVGVRPFEAATVSELGWKILEGKPAPPSARRAGVDPRVEAVCLQALSAAREERPASARALALALTRACGEGAPPAARPAPGVAPAALTAALGALLAAGLSTWVLSERRRAGELARAREGAAARAEELEAAGARARAARARVEAVEGPLARAAATAREAGRRLEERRAEDLSQAAERAAHDGHLGQVLDAAIERLARVPGAAPLRASLLLSRGRHDEGLDVCARARAAGDLPDAAEAAPALLLLQLRLELAAGRDARVAALAEELLRLGPPDGAAALFAQALSERSRGAPEAAQRLIAQALLVDPRAAHLHALQAGLLRAAGERAQRRDLLLAASEAATRSIELDPLDPAAYRERCRAALALALLPAASVDETRERGRAALQDLRLARELRPEPEAWVEGGVLGVLMGQPLTALAELDVALEQAPRAWSSRERVHRWRGHAQAQLGREEEALREWREGRLETLPVTAAALHARWLGLVSAAARARALKGAPALLRGVEEAIAAGP